MRLVGPECRGRTARCGRRPVSAARRFLPPELPHLRTGDIHYPDRRLCEHLHPIELGGALHQLHLHRPAGAQAGTQTYQWELDRITPGNQWLLGIGDLGGTGTYTLQATAETTDQQIIIDGAAASGTDAALTTTKYIALGISNSGTQAGSAVFSHFAFTPLPAQPPAQSTSTAALPTTTKDKVVVWYTDTGKAELALLTDSIDTVGHAATLSAQGAACAKLATAVTTARADPQVPDPAARSWLAQALTESARRPRTARQDFLAQHGAVQPGPAEVRLATADIEQFNTAIGAD